MSELAAAYWSVVMEWNGREWKREREREGRE